MSKSFFTFLFAGHLLCSAYSDAADRRSLSVCVRACVTSSADQLQLYNTVSFTTNCCDSNICQLVWSPSAFRCSLETQQQNKEIRLACKLRQYAVLLSTVTYLNERWMIMLLLLPLPLPLLMLLFSDFCCYQQHTLNVLFSPHLTFQSDWLLSLLTLLLASPSS